MPGFFFDKGCPLRQKAQRGHGLFQCGQECICGFGFQKSMRYGDDGMELCSACGVSATVYSSMAQISARSRAKASFKGEDSPRLAWSRPVCIMASNSSRPVSITGGEPGGQVQRKMDAVPQDDLTVRHINED